MSLLAAFILRPCQWDAQAEAWAKLLPHDAPEDHSRHLSQRISSGSATAYEIADSTGRAGILICSVNRDYPEPEFVLEAAISRENFRDLTAEFFPQIEAKARELGCRTIRFHTMRAGMVRRAQAEGYRVCEVICRKTIAS